MIMMMMIMITMMILTMMMFTIIMRKYYINVQTDRGEIYVAEWFTIFETMISLKLCN